jgi:hypothetical protein
MHGKYVLSHGMKTWSGTVNKGARLALRREKNAFIFALQLALARFQALN